MEVAGIPISHPARVVYAALGTTKGEIARYYEEIAHFMLPYVRGHLLSVVRCPQGAESKCFFQKHPLAPDLPGVRTVEVQEKTKTDEHMLVEDSRGLVALAQYGVLEVHAWAALGSAPEEPRRLVFDLDPGRDVPFEQVIDAAHRVRELLAGAALDSYVMTTGGLGMHVLCPIKGAGWKQARDFATEIAKRIERDAPERFTTNMRKSERTGRIFLDYLRNGRGATSVVPYSTRARPDAPVATPLAWKELDRLEDPQAYNVKNIFRRLTSLTRDPWEGFLHAHSLDATRAAQ